MENDPDVKLALVGLLAQIKQIAEDTSELRHVLLTGNGSPPLTVTVARLDERIKALEEKKQDEKMPRQVTIALVVSILLGLGSILVVLVKGP